MTERPLCWTQRSAWLDHCCIPVSARHECTMVGMVRIPGESTVESVRTALDLIVERHETLRTTFHAAHLGAPAQRVHPPAPVPLEIRELPTYQQRAQWVAELKRTVFDLERQLPIRAGLATVDAAPVLLVLAVSHVCLDAWSHARLLAELGAVHEAVRRGADPPRTPVARQPIELVEYEQSAEGRQANLDAIAYWREELSQVPADMFARTRKTVPGEPVTRRALLHSGAGADALRGLAARYGTWPAVVAHAAFTVMLARYSGHGTVACKQLAFNRQFRRLARVMNCAALPVLSHVGVGDDPPFAEVVRRAAAASVRALSHSYCAYDQALEAAVLEGSRRGVELRIGTVLNFQQAPGRGEPAARSRLEWQDAAWQYLNEDVHLLFSLAPDGLVISLDVRSAVMRVADIEGFLWGIEALLLRQSRSPADLRVSELGELVGLPAPPAAGPGWAMLDNCWVDLDSTRACLESCPAVERASVSLRDGVLTAFVAGRGARPDPAELRGHLLGHAHEYGAVMCPGRFVICRPVADRAVDRAELPTLPVIAEGSGLPAPPSTPKTPRERRLYEAVASANDLSGFSMADNYVAAGGAVLNLPRLQGELRSRGVLDIPAYAFLTPSPLQHLAARTDGCADTTEADISQPYRRDSESGQLVQE